MTSDITQERQQVQALLVRLSAEKLKVARSLLEVIVDDEEELTEPDCRAVAASREYFERAEKAFPSSRWSPISASLWTKFAAARAIKQPREEDPFWAQRPRRGPCD